MHSIYTKNDIGTIPAGANALKQGKNNPDVRESIPQTDEFVKGENTKILPAEQNAQESAPAEPAPPVSKPTLNEKQTKAVIDYLKNYKGGDTSYAEYNTV